MEEEKEANYWDSAIQHVEQFVTTKLKIYKFEIIEQLTLIGASLIRSLFTNLIFVFCFVFALFAGAYAVGEYTGHIYLGFLFITLFLLLLGIIFYNCKKWLKKKFLDFLIRKVFEK